MGESPASRMSGIFSDSDYTREYHAHKKKVHSVAWNSNGQRLASGSTDKTARVWALDDHRKGKEIELKGHTDSVDQLCWDPTHPDQLATASADKTVRVWDARSGKCSHKVDTSGENINISWSPDGKQIAVGNKNDVLTVIETRKMKKSQEKSFPYEVNEFAWDPSGKYFCLAQGERNAGYVEVLNASDFSPFRKQMAHTASCYCIEFAPNGRYLTLGGADAIVTLWDTSELIAIKAFDSMLHAVRALSFNHDSTLLAVASEDPFVDIVDVGAGEIVHRLETGYAMNTIAFHPTENLLAHAGDDKDKDDYDMGSVKVFGFTRDNR